jgi:hypothetical protein
MIDPGQNRWRVSHKQLPQAQKILKLLIQAGYHDDPRIQKGFQWLLSMRQSDQGWTIPILTHKFDRATQYRLTSEYAPPSSRTAPNPSRTIEPAWSCAPSPCIRSTGYLKPPGPLPIC